MRAALPAVGAAAGAGAGAAGGLFAAMLNLFNSFLPDAVCA
jgi:hypothetical protein